MIELMPDTDVARRGVDARDVQCISPYLNPAHVLAPPRPWLESLLVREWSWPFFRLRYKNLLWERYRAEPERFEELLRGSEGVRQLVLTCHCLTTHCHREIAKEFLERLRERRGELAARAPGLSSERGRTPHPAAASIAKPEFTRPDARLPHVSRPAFALQMLTGPEIPPPPPRAHHEAPQYDRVANG